MSLSRPQVHPPSVDFIDNGLPSFHDAFENPQSRFDTALGRYIPAPMKGSDALDGLRQAQPVKESMAFWDAIFQMAMGRLKELQPAEPSDRVRSGNHYSIRAAGNWPSVYSQLQKAREHYDGKTKGFWGWHCKEALRWVVDHSDPVEQAIKYVLNIEYVSPVLAAVEVILDVSNRASPATHDSDERPANFFQGL
jgi:hypothetical protein